MFQKPWPATVFRFSKTFLEYTPFEQTEEKLEILPFESMVKTWLTLSPGMDIRM